MTIADALSPEYSSQSDRCKAKNIASRLGLTYVRFNCHNTDIDVFM